MALSILKLSWICRESGFAVRATELHYWSPFHYAESTSIPARLALHSPVSLLGRSLRPNLSISEKQIFSARTLEGILPGRYFNFDIEREDRLMRKRFVDAEAKREYLHLALLCQSSVPYGAWCSVGFFLIVRTSAAGPSTNLCFPKGR